jgi:5-methylcytosine-specific restriction endonuclease McrA
MNQVVFYCQTCGKQMGSALNDAFTHMNLDGGLHYVYVAIEGGD